MTEEALSELITLSKKYGIDEKLDEGAGWGDLYDEILSRDKYLALADVLYETRCDWSEGFKSARSAINSFDIETDEDGMIYDELSQIADQVEDGREFRDCIYSYDYLFSKVDDDLYRDYINVKGHVK